jgi:DNA primase
MANNIIDRVKELPILDVFHEFFPEVELKPEGRRTTCLCPFHNEKTPSLKINVEKNTWKCFGCEASGSNIDLVIKKGLADSPLQAARIIAEKFGIEFKQKTRGGMVRKR